MTDLKILTPLTLDYVLANLENPLFHFDLTQRQLKALLIHNKLNSVRETALEMGLHPPQVQQFLQLGRSKLRTRISAVNRYLKQGASDG